MKKAHKRGIRFALSNVIKQGDRQNTILSDWIKVNKFNLINLDYHYNNANYQKKDKEEATEEVLITNYQ